MLLGFIFLKETTRQSLSDRFPNNGTVVAEETRTPTHNIVVMPFS